VAALVVALGGSAYAAARINGKDITKHSISGNRLMHNTLTGAQIKESTLGTVPAARTARTAGTAKTAASATTAHTATSAGSVNGNVVTTFAFTVLDDGAFQTVAVPGAAMTADCGGGTVNLDVAGTADTGESYVVEGSDLTGGAFSMEDTSLTTGDDDGLSPDTATSGAGVAVITRGSSAVTTIDFSYRANPGNSCTYNGSVVGSS
jgi:hypothetical protein